MDFPLFSKIFFLILIAEMGDKTQLALLAQSAGTSSRWTILIAAVFALVLSTALAVLLGGALNRVLPPRGLKIAGGVLFLVFGVLMLREGFARGGNPGAPAAPGQTQQPAE